jgi:hypothetical protein
MRTPILLCAAIILAGATTANAALAPNYQRAREIAAVVEAVAALVESHPIDQVTALGADQYEVLAGPCGVVANLVPLPSDGMAGPLKFTVELSEPDCAA